MLAVGCLLAYVLKLPYVPKPSTLDPKLAAGCVLADALADVLAYVRICSASLPEYSLSPLVVLALATNCAAAASGHSSAH